MAEQQEKMDIQGRPYFIHRVGDSGIYRAVGAICLSENAWCYECSSEELAVGRDMIEMPTRDLMITVRAPNGSFLPAYFVAELRKFAEVSWSDYVSYEEFGCRFGRFVKKEGSNLLFELKPRIFRKINND